MTIEFASASRILFGGLFGLAAINNGTATAAAVAQYKSARRSPASVVLGHFVCPAGRLEELAGHLTTGMSPGEAGWRVAVRFDESSGASAASAQAFHTEMDPAATIVTTTGRPGNDLELTAAALLSVNQTVHGFVEIPVTAGYEMLAAVVAARGSSLRRLGAGFHFGGPAAEPPAGSHDTIRLLRLCRDHDLPLRAVAGLDAPVATTGGHGFMNLLAAAVAVEDGGDDQIAIEALEERDPEAFRLTRAALTYRGRVFGVDVLRRTRTRRLVGIDVGDFGSVVDGLRRLGWLPMLSPPSL